MAVVKNLMVRCGADFSQLTAATNKARTSVAAMSASVKKSGKGMTAALGGVKAGLVGLAVAVGTQLIGAYREFKKESQELYRTQQEQEVKLATIMKQRMGAVNGLSQSMRDLFAAEQQLGVVGDEVQMAGAQQLATFLTTEKALQALVPAMNNLIAQQYGYTASAESAKNIGNLFGKAMQGQTSALRRVGITFTAAEEAALKYANEEERAAMLARIITNNVGQMNAALGSTDYGRMVQVKNAMSDVKETFGQAFSTINSLFTPAASAAAAVLQKIANAALVAANAIAWLFGKKQTAQIAAASSGADGLAESYDDVAGAVGGAGKAAQKAFASFDKINQLNTSSGGGGGGGGGASASASATTLVESSEVAQTSTALDKLKEKLQPLKDGFDKLKESAGKLWEALQKIFQSPAFQAFVDFLQRQVIGRFESAIQIITTIFEYMSDVIDLIVAVMNGDWATAWDKLKEIASDLFNVWLGLVEFIIGPDGVEVITKAWNWLKEKWDWVQEKIGEGCDWIKEKWQAIFGEKSVMDILKGLPAGFLKVIANMIDAAIVHVNKFIAGINDKLFFTWDALTIGGKQIFGAGKFRIAKIPTLDRISVPALASGGIVDRATLAMIGEAGREAVVPLDKAGGLFNPDVNINFNGSLAALARVLMPEIKVEQKRVGGNLVQGVY